MMKCEALCATPVGNSGFEDVRLKSLLLDLGGYRDVSGAFEDFVVLPLDSSHLTEDVLVDIVIVLTCSTNVWHWYEIGMDF